MVWLRAAAVRNRPSRGGQQRRMEEGMGLMVALGLDGEEGRRRNAGSSTSLHRPRIEEKALSSQRCQGNQKMALAVQWPTGSDIKPNRPTCSDITNGKCPQNSHRRPSLQL
jgi:hypothetical protein